MKILIFLFAAGGLAAFLVGRAFPPVGYGTFILGLAAVWFIGAAVLGWAAKNDDGEATDSYYPKKVYIAIAFLPWTAAALLYANAALDPSTCVGHPSAVLSRSKGRSGTDIEVSSWLQNHRTLTIPIEAQQYDSMLPGTPVEVEVRSGALTIPWIVTVKLRP